MAEQIKDGIYWIGVDNPDGRDFHGISTPRGGSYNSYLISAGKTAIIDGTNTPFFDDYMRSLRTVVEPEKIAYIIINHAEPDHTGALKDMLDIMPQAKVVCTAKCKEFLEAAYSIQAGFITVEDGDELDLEDRKLRFFLDPMVHWPETMMTYSVDDSILFSADLFGTEISHESLFADRMEPFLDLTRDYFAIVMRPFASPVKKAIDKARSLEIDILAPSHGPVYRRREDIERIIAYFERLATAPEEDKVLIVYCSIWHSNAKMAEAIAKGIEAKGIRAEVYDIASSNLVELMAQAMTSKAIMLGSLTIIGGYHPLFESLFPFLKLNNQKGKLAAVFGTHGWAPVAVGKLKARLEELQYDVIGDIDMRFGPREDDDFLKLRELGTAVADRVASVPQDDRS